MKRHDTRTFSMAAVVRATGISEHSLRAWERRYGAISPTRTEGGTRRFSDEDVARLMLLQAAVDAGHSIGTLAHQSDAELRARIARPEPAAGPVLARLAEAVAQLDAHEVERVLTEQFQVLGARAFAAEVAAPLLHRIGEDWQHGRLPIAAEHLVTSSLRSLLGAALRPPPSALPRPPLLFGTPSGEVHEFGALIAAVTAVALGAHVLYLGPQLPVDDLALAVSKLEACVVALSLVRIDREAAAAYLASLRSALDASVEIWVGGRQLPQLEPMRGVRSIESLAALERHVTLLGT